METWFSAGIVSWYSVHKRDLPWRAVSDPYKIWLSEIILQQTQVVQGLSYYQKFVNTFPKVTNLAKASEDEVLKLWQGLGYYSRARNLHAASKMIVNQFGGHFPKSYAEIISLKGIGEYTAAAIASFAYNQPYAVVDGNVYRVLSRVFGVEMPIDTSLGKKQFQELANSLLNRKQPGIHNQAIMEFGSQYCKPVNPDCEHCIFKTRCFAFQSNKVDLLPIKEKKVKVKNRFFNYLILADEKNKIAVSKRTGKDIWQGLYQFPLVETTAEVKLPKLFSSAQFKQIVPSEFSLIHSSKKYKHILTHQHLHAQFHVLKIKKQNSSAEKTSSLNQLNLLAFPRLIEKFMDDCDLKEML